MGKVRTFGQTLSRCGVNKSALASILQGVGSKRSAPASAAAAAANIAGKDKWLTWRILHSGAAPVTREVLLKGTSGILFMAPWQEEAVSYLLKIKRGIG